MPKFLLKAQTTKKESVDTGHPGVESPVLDSATTMPITRHLNCLIEGEDTVFTINAAGDHNVSDLRESIQKRQARDSLKDVGPDALGLWKVSAIDDPLCEMTWLFSA